VAIVAASLLLTLWLGVALVRAENERYALLLGLCRDASGEADVECLASVQTRPAWWWHVAYALGG